MISVANLKKRFDKTEALKGVSLEIKKGEFYGLLGPNGAGKTTFINILSTVQEYDSGDVHIGEFNLKFSPNRCKEIIGVAPQEIALYGDLSAYDNLMFWGSLYHLSTSELKEKIETYLKLLGLFERKNDKIQAYSGGMKRRVNIAAAMLHSPQILLLDEPTVGVDPQSRNLIFEVIQKFHQEGITIVYTTHYMEEAERLCDRIGIIDSGRIIAEGTLADLKKIQKIKEVIVINFDDLDSVTSEKLQENLQGDFKLSEGNLYYYTDKVGRDLTDIITKLTGLGLSPSHIDIKRVNLETIFLSLTGKSLRD